MSSLNRYTGRLVAAAGNGITRVTDRALGPYQSAIIRIGFCATWLLFLLREFPHRRELYGPDGPWSWELAQRLITDNDAFTVLMWSDSMVWFEIVYVLAILSTFLLLLGWRTRAVSVLFMVGVLSLQNRSVFMGDGGDNVIHLMAIYLVFVRCAQVWSLDARRARRTRERLERSGVQSADEARALPALVAFSDSMRERSQALKSFLFRNLYRHPQVVETTGRARRVIQDLFDRYLAEPGEMPDAHGQRRHLERAVADYIAGMTDRFAIREHERLFGAVLFP